VLSGKTPFAGDKDFIVMRKVIEGERPERPEGSWFTDNLWETLEQCWLPQPKDRPTVEAVLECLGQVPKARLPPPPIAAYVEIDGDKLVSATIMVEPVSGPSAPNEQGGIDSPYDSPLFTPVDFNAFTGGPTGLPTELRQPLKRGRISHPQLIPPPPPQQNTASSRAVPPALSEYVMTEGPGFGEEPPPRPTPPPHFGPPPLALSSSVPNYMAMPQWEIPPISSSAFYTGTSVADLSASLRPMTADQLMTTWGRVGTRVHQVAVELFNRSEWKPIGDGTYTGFVNAVLRRVPNALIVEGDAPPFGFLIYAQTGPSVTRRVVDFGVGDIIFLQDVKLKGRKGIKLYEQTAGAGTPVVAVIVQYEPRDSKVTAYQTSRHVGGQAVESVSYRLRDLKSGTVEVFRVLES